MSQEAILEKVRSIVAEQLSVDSGEVKPESNFQNDLGADCANLRRCATTSAMDSHAALSLEGNIQNTFVHIAVSDLHEEGLRKRARSVPRSARLALPQDECMINERALPTVGFSSNMLDAFSAAASEPPQECHVAELSVEDELCAKDREIENLRCLLRQAEADNAELKRRCSSSSCSSTASHGNSMSWADVSDSDNEETEHSFFSEATIDEGRAQSHTVEQAALQSDRQFRRRNSCGVWTQCYAPANSNRSYKRSSANWAGSRRQPWSGDRW